MNRLFPFVWCEPKRGHAASFLFAALTGRWGIALVSAFILQLCAIWVPAQHNFEGRRIGEVSIVFDRPDPRPAVAEPFRIIARDAIGQTYSAVRIRNAIADLYQTEKVEIVSVEASEASGEAVDLLFRIRRKIIARRVAVRLDDAAERSVTEAELLLRVNLLDPGATVSEQTLQANAESLVEYLRERGYYRAEARYEQQQLQNPDEVAVTYRVTAGPQSLVERFEINIQGADTELLTRGLRLSAGSPFSRDALTRDLDRIRENLRGQGFLAPSVNEPRVIFDSETNRIDVVITGTSGPEVEVIVATERESIGSRRQRQLLPIKRDGSLDFAAIIEGERRLENYYQERGYFFADVTSVCSVEPPLVEADSTVISNETEFLCSALGSYDLIGRQVTVKYNVDLNRRLRLVEIRLEGTTQFTIDEIRPAIDSQVANILGIIPLFGYGRGYTSQRILDEDTATIRSLLRELGYRDATVRVNQGVSLDGENLIITFVVDEGEPTIVSDVEIDGNTAFSDDVLFAELPVIEGMNFSIAKVRNGQRRLSEFYANAGYFDAVVSFSIDEITDDSIDTGRRYRVVFNVQNEGVPVYVDRVLVSGNLRTKDGAILRAVEIEPGTLLRAAEIYSSEQNLYASDAFERVEVRTQPAGDRADGGRNADVIVEVTEQSPRLVQWGGGFSTDVGWSGFADIRHFNLLGNLWQGGAFIRWSQRRQLVGLDFVNPRFIRDGQRGFAPLTLSAQYQRDATVTRFFRSAFDRGTFGIVQRLDEEGNPIDEFGAPAGSPTLDRLTFTAETNRTLSRRDRSLVFFKYRFENVRLSNIRSLLIRDLLEPDDRVRISGFGATFVRDTRRRCGIEYTVLDIIARGEPGEPCRYNASDPTNGDYFTAEYNVSVPALGANIGFHKFQASYRYYYSFPKLKNTTLAAQAVLGVATVFSRTADPGDNPLIPEIEKSLPISERFFAGGGNTLRGFEFESAGPRVAIVPEGDFRNSDGELVTLTPFTVPFGGNAVAIVNVEARVPFTRVLRLVPFYDGGNVFRRAGDIFRPPSVEETDLVRRNLRSVWSHTVGLGLRLKTPVGAEFGVDYGYLLNPPTFLVPQGMDPPATIRLRPGRLHFRFSQAF